MMAPGEIRLSTMTMRRMPVLAQSQNSTLSAGVGAAATASDVIDEIVVTATRAASVAFATTGVFVFSVLFPSNLSDGVVSARQNKPPNDARDPTGAKAPGKPGAAEGFSDPKGGEAWGQAPNGDWGWVDGDGNVWVPTGQGGSAHGGPHWDVNQPGGGYGNVYPGGKSRPGGP